MLDPLLLEGFGKYAFASVRATAGALGNLGRNVAEIAAKRVGGVGAGAGVGALGGAALGGAVGGVKSYKDARAEGADGMGAVARGLGGGLQSAVSGAGLGALAGGALGAAGLNTAALERRTDLLGSSARFGQRQVHGLTGAVPMGPGSKIERIRAMGAGAAPAQARLDAALKAKAPEEVVGRARAGLAAASRAEELGMTSVPGFAKAVATRPMEALPAAVMSSWRGAGPTERVLQFGLPALGIASSLSSPDRGAVAESALGATAPLVVPSTLPLSGMVAAGSLLSKGARTVGAGIDTMRQRSAETTG
jgi:hypothetical protein